MATSLIVLFALLLHQARQVAIRTAADGLDAVPHVLPHLPGAIRLPFPDRELPAIIANSASSTDRSDRYHVGRNLKCPIAIDRDCAVRFGESDNPEVLEILFPPGSKLVLTVQRGVVGRHAHDMVRGHRRHLIGIASLGCRVIGAAQVRYRVFDFERLSTHKLPEFCTPGCSAKSTVSGHDSKLR